MNEAYLDKMKVHPAVIQGKLLGGGGGEVEQHLSSGHEEGFLGFFPPHVSMLAARLENTFFGAGARQEQPCLYGTLEC